MCRPCDFHRVARGTCPIDAAVRPPLDAYSISRSMRGRDLNLLAYSISRSTRGCDLNLLAGLPAIGNFFSATLRIAGTLRIGFPLDYDALPDHKLNYLLFATVAALCYDLSVSVVVSWVKKIW